MQFANALREHGLAVGLVLARQVTIKPASEKLNSWTRELLRQRAQTDFPPPELKDKVRQLLRTGGFKPSGRSKPASEYLAAAAREQRFPAIYNLVDVNNAVSLSSGFPISLLDADVVGEKLDFRFGLAGEKYVFNSVGQEIDLAGLICARGLEPLGSPVKDSMKGKITEKSRNVVGIIYAPAADAACAASLRDHLQLFGEWLESEGEAAGIETHLL